MNNGEWNLSIHDLFLFVNRFYCWLHQFKQIYVLCHSYSDSAVRIKFSLVSLLVYISKSSHYLLGRGEKSFVHEIILRLHCSINFPSPTPHRPFRAAERAGRSYNASLSIGDKVVKTDRKLNFFGTAREQWEFTKLLQAKTQTRSLPLKKST